MLSKFVAVEMTSHQNSPFPFESMPAWINIALALLISAGILFSTTDFCWGVSVAVNSKITPKFCLSHSFWRLLFSPLLSSLIFFISIPYFFDKPFYPHWYQLNLITLSAQRETVNAVTELIHCNQPMPVPPSANLLEGSNVYEYPVPRSGW